MKKNYKKICLTLFFILLTVLLLRYPADSFFYASKGLTLWYERMIPTLLPFMIVSSVMISLNLTEGFTTLLRPFLQPLFLVSANGLYAIIVGFLCGFPMGARVIAQLYENGKLSKAEASYLLSFCNNIGPIYFVSFVLPTIGITKPTLYLIGMYGLPLLYGILLRHTIYKNAFQAENKTPPEHKLLACSRIYLLDALDGSIMSSLLAIAKLGGYMVIFNLLNLLFLKIRDTFFLGAVALNCLLEITSGISAAGNHYPLLVLFLLPFGGLSCIAQTYGMIKSTDLSIFSYVCHKLVLTLLTVFFYLILLLQS